MRQRTISRCDRDPNLRKWAARGNRGATACQQTRTVSYHERKCDCAESLCTWLKSGVCVSPRITKRVLTPSRMHTPCLPWLRACHRARGEEPTVVSVMACGIVSSSVGIVATYPLSLIRTRLQVGLYFIHSASSTHNSRQDRHLSPQPQPHTTAGRGPSNVAMASAIQACALQG